MADTKIFGVTVNTDSLKKIPESYKIIGGIVFSLVVLLGGAYYLVYPIYEEYSVLYGENQKLSEENKTAETKLGYVPPNKYKAIDVIIEEKKLLDSEILKIKERIPSKENLASLIYDLERIVESNNKSDLYDIVPSALSKVVLPAELSTPIAAPPGGTAPSSDLNLSQINLSLNIDSNYPNLISLLKDFERYQRAIASTNLSLSPVDKEKKFNVLKTTLNLRAYVLPEGGK